MPDTNNASTLLHTVPTFLRTPVNASVSLPVSTHPQELPFEQLTWENFEKLCLRLIEIEADVEYCRIYGKKGDDQGGIDIFAQIKQSAKFRTYQCKNEKDFGPARIEEAVNVFLAGEWLSRSEAFVLCTREDMSSKIRLDAYLVQAGVLRARNVAFKMWDCVELSRKLKDKPRLVDDFFGRPWVTAFCGQDQSALLTARLDAAQVVEYRKRLGEFYRILFNKHDPGMPSFSYSTQQLLELEQRYILPDIYRDRIIIASASSDGQIS